MRMGNEMGALTEIPSNIQDILDVASEYAAKMEQERFRAELWSRIRESVIKSPIEQALFIGIHTVAKSNFMDFSEPLSATEVSPGLSITPQKKIGPYYADFVVEFYRRNDSGTNLLRSVVVECDGTAFHERTEKERRHEKLRDRYMQKMDLKVFRYTGKEILDNPYKVAKEIISYVSDDEFVLSPEEYFR